MSRKAHGGPNCATIKPPIAGPIDRAIFMPIELSATAEASNGRGTSSETIAACAGIAIAAPMPMAKVSATSTQGVSNCRCDSSASDAATSSIQPWVSMR